MSVDEYHRRTAITRLLVSSTDESRLRETIEEWKRGCQIAVDMAWEYCHSKTDIQQFSYDDVREQTELGSQHAVLACHQAAENIKSCISRRKEGKKASKPTYTSPTITYDSRTMTVFPEQEQVSLTTHGDHSRVRVDLVLPDNEDGYQYQYLSSEEWELTESTLHYRNGSWYLHLGFRKPKQSTGDTETTENGTVLGVDLGVNQIAVTSTARFFSAGELNHNRREFEQVRGDLQDHGSRNAHRTLETVSGRETEYVKQVLHTVANGIVEEALRYNCDGIIFEELDGIRKQLPDAAWHSKWAFDRLYEYVDYKAAAGRGIRRDDRRKKHIQTVRRMWLHSRCQPLNPRLVRLQELQCPKSRRLQRSQERSRHVSPTRATVLAWEGRQSIRPEVREPVRRRITESTDKPSPTKRASTPQANGAGS